MLVAAAALTADGKPTEARPVFVRALRDAGVHENTVADINAVLATTPVVDGTQPKPAGKWTDSGATPKAVAPEKLLAAAKIDFHSGRPLLGYERLGTYAMHVSAEPETARAVKIAFVQPIREIREIRSAARTEVTLDSPAPATDSADASPDAAAGAATASSAAAATKP